MRAIFKVLKRELDTLLTRKDILAIMFGMPIFVCILLWQFFIYNVPRDLPIAILNQDNSSISRTLVRMIDATPSCETKYDVLSLKEGKDLIVSGKAYALLVIPRDFKKNLFRATHPQIVYYFNNQAILISGIMSKDITTAVMTFGAGINAKILMTKGLPEYAAIANTNPVGIDEHIRSNPYMNYSYFLTLALFVHTFQVLIAAISCWAIGRELKNGTAKDWLECADNSIIIGLIGKLMPYTFCFLFIITVVYMLYFGIYGAPFSGNMLFAAFATILYVIAYEIAPIMYIAVTSSLRFSLSCTAFYTALGFTFEGMTYPKMAMPWAGQAYSSLLPLSHYLALMVDQTIRDFPVVEDLHYIVNILLLIAAALFFIPWLKKRCLTEKDWYQI
jgi:ABC-2 type transport system permease protein